MKAKYYIGIFSALLLAGMSEEAQCADNICSGDEGARFKPCYEI